MHQRTCERQKVLEKGEGSLGRPGNTRGYGMKTVVPSNRHFIDDRFRPEDHWAVRAAPRARGLSFERQNVSDEADGANGGSAADNEVKPAGR
jgi:hypothetical protein